MPFWKQHAARITSLALLLASGAATAQPQEPARLAAAWGSPAPQTVNAASFNEVATANTHTTPVTLDVAASASTRSPDRSTSPWWLASMALPIPALALWALRRRSARTPTDDDDAPAGWAITRWMTQSAPSNARGWRLSRFEELPEPDFTPLYGSLDDDARPTVDNVVPLHRAAHAPQTPSARQQSRITGHDTSDVIDIEARLVTKAP